MEKDVSNRAALAGLRVVDLSRMIAGPLAGQMLGDLGADVIKVERSGAGDDVRQNSAVFLPDDPASGARNSAHFVSVNRNKRGVTADLATAEGQALVRALAETADVLIENYRPGALARWGLDHDSLSRLNPGLIYCSVTGYGQDGPYAMRPGYDPVFQAQSGIMSVTGVPEGQPGAGPMRAGINLADYLGGVHAVVGILAALVERTRSGCGQQVDIGLLDGGVAAMAGTLQAYLISGALPKRYGNAAASSGPNGVFACRDGDVVISVGNDRQFRSLCVALGIPAAADDPRLALNADRGRHRDLAEGVVRDACHDKTRVEVERALLAAEVPAGAVLNVAEIMADPQVANRGLSVPLPHPLMPGLQVVASPVRLSRSPVVYDRPPPLLGEHDAEVRAELAVRRPAG